LSDVLVISHFVFVSEFGIRVSGFLPDIGQLGEKREAMIDALWSQE